jgi:hypothetical protein
MVRATYANKFNKYTGKGYFFFAGFFFAVFFLAAMCTHPLT